MTIITVNVSQRILAGLRRMRDEGITPSVSEAVRKCVDFALPHVLGLYSALDDYVAEPANYQPDFGRLEQEYKPPARSELREKFPDISDYKFMNE